MLRKQIAWLLLFSLICLGILTRIGLFTSQSKPLYWDEVAIAVDARSVAYFATDIHGKHWLQPFFLSYGDYKLPGYIWAVSVLYLILPDFDWIVRLPNLFGGIATVFLTAHLGVTLYQRYCKQLPKLEEKKFFVSIAAMGALSPWAIHFSIVGFESAFAQFLVLLSFVFVLKSFEQRKIHFLLISVLLGAFATYTYFAVQFIWPLVFIAFTVLEWFKSSNSVKRTLIGVSITALLLYAAILVPMWRSSSYSASQTVRLSAASVLNNSTFVIEANQVQSIANSSIDGLFFNRRVFWLKKIVTNITTHLHPSYLFFTGDQNPRHGTGVFGLFLYPTFVFFIVGLLSLILKSRKVSLFILFWLVVALVPASIPLEVPHAQRSLFALAPLSLILGFGLFWMLTYQTNKITQFFITATTLAIVCGTLFSFMQFVHYYRTIYPTMSKKSWQDTYRDIAHDAVELSKSYETVYVQTPDTRLYLWMLLYEYSPNEVQQIRQTGTEFSSFDTKLQLRNIKFRAETFLSDSGNSVLLAEPGYVSSVFSAASLRELDRYPTGYGLYAQEK